MYTRDAARRDLVLYGRKIEEKNLVVGPGGNTSARAGDIVYIKASGVAFEDAVEDDYVGIDMKTGKVVSTFKKPSCEILMHLGCYSARDDIAAVVHTHSPYATAVASAGQTIPPFFPDYVALMGPEIPLIEYVVPASKELADRVVDAARRHNVILLANHGVVALGANVREAYFRALCCEAAAQTFVIGRMLGGVRPFTDEEVQQINNLEAEDYRRELLRGRRT